MIGIGLGIPSSLKAGGAAAFAPADLAGLQLNLRQTFVGNPNVTQYTDDSSNNNHATAAVGQEGTLVAYGGGQGIDFDPAQDFYSLTSSIVLAGDFSICWTMNVDDLSTHRGLFYENSLVEGSEIRSTGVLRIRTATGSNVDLTAAAAVATGSADRWMLFRSGSALLLYKNKVDVTSGTPTDAGSLTFDWLGRYSTREFDGKIGSFVVWNQNHNTAGNRSDIDSWLTL